jgi:hypothetical protein
MRDIGHLAHNIAYILPCDSTRRANGRRGSACQARHERGKHAPTLPAAAPTPNSELVVCDCTSCRTPDHCGRLRPGGAPAERAQRYHQRTHQCRAGNHKAGCEPGRRRYWCKSFGCAGWQSGRGASQSSGGAGEPGCEPSRRGHSCAF